MQTPFNLLIKSLVHYREHVSTYIGYSAWILLPFLGFIITSALPENILTNALIVIFLIAEIFISVWVVIISILLTVRLDEKKPDAQKNVHIDAVQKIKPLVTVAILQLLIVLGGALLLIIPGLIFAVWYSMGQNAVVLDNKKGIDAISYSKALVKGRFWYAAWGVIGIPILITLIYSVFIALLVSAISAMIGMNPFDILVMSEPPVWIMTIDAIGDMLMIPLFMIYITFFYVHMKQTHVDDTLNDGCNVQV